MRCYESNGGMIDYYYPFLIDRITACCIQYQLTYWHCFLRGNVLPDPNGTRTIYFGDANCKRLIPLPVATFDCHIHCKRVQICTNPISWYFPLKSRFLIKSIAGGYSYAEGTAADFEATWTPLWSGKWRLHRTARAGKMWFLFFELGRHADLESHLSSFCWFSGYPCVCVCKHLGTRWNGFSTILQQVGIPPIRVNAQRRGSDKVLISRLITWTYLTNWTFDKLWPFGVSAISDVCPMSFRLPPDLDPMNFDDFSIQIRHFFDLFWFISVGISNSPLTNYRLDYVGQCLNFPCYVNRGLWDAIPLPRTIPDKHVELSSVCVSPPGATSSRLDGPSEKVQVRLYPVDVSKRNQGVPLCAMD